LLLNTLYVTWITFGVGCSSIQRPSMNGNSALSFHMISDTLATYELQHETRGEGRGLWRYPNTKEGTSISYCTEQERWKKYNGVNVVTCFRDLILIRYLPRRDSTLRISALLAVLLHLRKPRSSRRRSRRQPDTSPRGWKGVNARRGRVWVCVPDYILRQ